MLISKCPSEKHRRRLPQTLLSGHFEIGTLRLLGQGLPLIRTSHQARTLVAASYGEER